VRHYLRAKWLQSESPAMQSSSGSTGSLQCGRQCNSLRAYNGGATGARYAVGCMEQRQLWQQQGQ
jgi:hypothetical protein